MRFVIYRDTERQWRWRLVAANGRIFADSAEGYARRGGCLHGIRLVRRAGGATMREGTVNRARTTR